MVRKTRCRGKGGTPAFPRKSPLFRRTINNNKPQEQQSKLSTIIIPLRRTSPFQKSKTRSVSYKETLSFLSQCDTGTQISCMTCKNTGEIETLRIIGEDYTKVRETTNRSGTFGSIVKYTNAQNTETYAIKSFKESPTEDSYFEEIIVLLLLKTEKKYPKYLIPAYPVILKDCYFNIMHFKEDTLQGLKKKSPALLEKNKIAIFNDILNGMISLANLNYLYGDLKAANTLFTLRKDNRVKIYLADLGGIAPYGVRHQEMIRDKIDEFFESAEIPVTQKLIIQKKYMNNIDNMVYCITGSPFTYPTKTYYPNVNVNTDLGQFLCHFFHQIVMMYFFLHNHDIRIYEHDKITNNMYWQTEFITKTPLHDQLRPFYFIQTNSEIIREYMRLKNETDVITKLVEDLKKMKIKGGAAPL